MRVGQLVPNLGFHDAIAREAWCIERCLRAAGHATALFAGRVHPRAADSCRPLTEYRTADWDAVILHHSTLSGGAELLAGTRGILLYHNITPPRYFYGVNPDLAGASARGLQQLAELLPAAAAVWADSAFNLAELHARGLDGGQVVPYLLDDNGVTSCPLPLSGAGEEGAPAPGEGQAVCGEPLLLMVGRVVPNKGHDLVLRAFARLREKMPAARLAVVGSDAGMALWRRRLDELAAQLGVSEKVCWAGECEDAELAAWYRRARVLVVASEHEGFCMPLLEAMRADLPVVALAQPAVEETLGGSGCVVTRRDPALLAAALQRMLSDGELRAAVIAAQRRRAAYFALARTGAAMLTALQGVLAGTTPRPTMLAGAVAVADAPAPPAAVARGARVRARYEPLLARARAARSAPAAAPPPDPARVLVVNPGHFGDVVLTSALLRALRDDGRVQRLGLLSGFAEGELRPLLPWVDEFHALRLAPFWLGGRAWPGGLRRVRAGNWTTVLTSRPDYTATLAAYLSGAPEVIGETGGPYDDLLTVPLPPLLTGGLVPIYEGERLARLAQPLGVTVADTAPVLARPAGEFSEAVARYATAGPYAVVHPGGATPDKCWPEKYWRELLADWPCADERIVIVGGPDERALAERLAAGLPRVTVAAGELAWPQTAALIAGARCLAGSDSGPLHLAAAYRLPLVALFGPGDARRFAPCTPGAVLLTRALPCAPCPQTDGGRNCPENICLTGLAVDTVRGQVAALPR